MNFGRTFLHLLLLLSLVQLPLGSQAEDALADPQSLAEIWFDEYPDLETISNDRQQQLLALVEFYFATNGPTEWNNTTNWLSYSVHECLWYNQAGDRSCNANQNVIELILQDNGLSGSIPQSIDNLDNLTRLNLAQNNLQDRIPNSIANLDKLRLLDLSANSNMNGTIPVDVYTMPSLRTLRLRTSQFSGTLPTEIGLSPNLRSIEIRDCLLVGTLPTEFGTMTALEELRLAENDLMGEIPSEMLSLDKLQVLNFEDNKLTGLAFPENVEDLPNLRAFNVRRNEIIGTLPTFLWQMTNLETFSIGGNPLLSGTIPTGDLELLVNLTLLHIRNTDLMGTLPGSVCSIDELFFDCGLVCGCDCLCGFQMGTPRPTTTTTSSSGTSAPTPEPSAEGIITEIPTPFRPAPFPTLETQLKPNPPAPTIPAPTPPPPPSTLSPTSRKLTMGSSFPLNRCEGDCDSDRDCQSGLICFQRDQRNAVPGCLDGENENSFTDFCIPVDATLAPTWEDDDATLAPTWTYQWDDNYADDNDNSDGYGSSSSTDDGYGDDHWWADDNSDDDEPGIVESATSYMCDFTGFLFC